MEKQMEIWKSKKQRIKEIIKNNILFIIGITLFMYKGLLLNYLLELPIEHGTIFYTFAVGMLVMSPIINRKDKFSYLYLNIVYYLATLVIHANFLYYSYCTNFISLYQIENLKYAREIGSGLWCIINIKNITIFWVDNIIITLLSIIAYKKTEKTVYKNKIVKVVLILAILGLNILTVVNRINDIYIGRIYNKTLIVQAASIYYYHFEDAKDYFYHIFFKEKVDEEKLKEIYEQKLEMEDQTTPYSNIAKGKNVIILQLESLNEYIIGKKVNGKEITPNLNKFFSENIYCNNMYNQGLGSTADSEFEMETSMYPLENGYVFQKYYNNTWADIYTTLENEGYNTSFMHPNTSTFWNREEVYKKGYKINEYYDILMFPEIEKAGGFYSDEGFYEQASNIINSYEGNFCTTLVSVTTHIPFSLEGVSNLENKVTITEDDIKEYENEVFRNYLISCNFADYAFGKFFEKLKQAGTLDNAILVVYGDHGASFQDQEGIEQLFLENNLKYTKLESYTKDIHVPFGIKVPGINENSIIERTVCKIDIKPTLLDLLGVENKFSMGESIFSNKDYSFTKGIGYITSKNYYIHDKYYNRETETEINATEELEKMVEKMENEIYLSDIIIKNNLLKNIENDK